MEETHYRNRAGGGTLCGSDSGRLVHSWSEVECPDCLAKRRSKPGPRPKEPQPQEPHVQEPHVQEPQVQAQEPQPQPQEPQPQEPQPQEPQPQEPQEPQPQAKPRQPRKGEAAQAVAQAAPPAVVYPPGFWEVMAESAVGALDGAAGKALRAPIADILAGDVAPPFGVPLGRVKRARASRQAFVGALAAFAEANAHTLPGPGVMLAAMGGQYLVALGGLKGAPAAEEE